MMCVSEEKEADIMHVTLLDKAADSSRCMPYEEKQLVTRMTEN